MKATIELLVAGSSVDESILVRRENYTGHWSLTTGNCLSPDLAPLELLHLRIEI